jgi:hypothetical protein
MLHLLVTALSHLFTGGLAATLRGIAAALQAAGL